MWPQALKLTWFIRAAEFQLTQQFQGLPGIWEEEQQEELELMTVHQPPRSSPKVD